MAIPPNMHMNDFDTMARGAWGLPTLQKPEQVEAQTQKNKDLRDAMSRPQWAELMRGVRVEGDTVLIVAKGGNDGARELCGALINEMNK